MAKRKKEISKVEEKHTGSIDYFILIVTAILLATGIIMLFSASTPTSIAETGKAYSYLRKQLISTAIGLVGMTVLSKIDYRIYKKFKWIFYLVSVGILAYVGVAGKESHNARRWLELGPMQIQPSEFAKIALILFFASYFSEVREKNITNYFEKIAREMIIPICYLGVIAVILIKLQNHMSATIIMAGVTAVQMFAASRLFAPFVFLSGGGVAGVIYIIQQALYNKNGSFRFQRIYTWKHIEEDLTDKGWQINQSLYAIGSGGLFGVGFGNSKQKYLYLPEPQNDFIFSVLAEELGFFGSAIVIFLFILFVWRGIVIAINAKDFFGSIIAVGIATMIGLQAVINIAVVTNTIPVTGMPLPFFSYGGTAMIANLCAVGILLNISKNSKKSE